MAALPTFVVICLWLLGIIWNNNGKTNSQSPDSLCSGNQLDAFATLLLHTALIYVVSNFALGILFTAAENVHFKLSNDEHCFAFPLTKQNITDFDYETTPVYKGLTIRFRVR